MAKRTGRRKKKTPEIVVEKKENKTVYGDLLYERILPHEITGIVPLIKEYYKNISFVDGAENPMPFIARINYELASNPYSMIYTCVTPELKPKGYIWFRIERDTLGKWFVTVEHDYVIPEIRNSLLGARVHQKLMSCVAEIAERCNCQYFNTEVHTTQLANSRKKLGLKPVSIKMTFQGDTKAFRNHNPAFQKYARYKAEEKGQ